MEMIRNGGGTARLTFTNVHAAVATWVSIALAAVVLALPAKGLAQTTAPASDPLQSLPQVDAPRADAVDIRTEQTAQAEKLAGVMAVSVRPERIEVVGTRAIPREWVDALFEDLRGREVTVGDLAEAANACTRLYREYEHALSFCYIPLQDFGDGVVRVMAVEGYISSISIHGDAGTLEERIRAIAQKLVGQRPLGLRRFERYTRLLGMLPGVRITLRVSAPTTTDGAMAMRLDVKRRRVDANVALDFNHPGIQGVVGMALNAPTPLGEKISASVLYPSGRGDQRFQALAYALPLGTDGLELRAGASRYRGRPSQRDTIFRREVEQDRQSMSLRYPVVLRKDRALVASGGAYAADQSDRYVRIVDGASAELQTRVRALHLEVEYVQAGKRLGRHASLGVTRGFDRWGASSQIVTTTSNPLPLDPASLKFTRVNANYRENRVFSGFGVRFAVTAQYAGNRLPPSERVSFGGTRFALAHDPGDAVGDRGWGASLELNRAFSVDSRWLKSLTPYVVAQHARVRLEDARARPGELGSFALGLRLSDKHRYSVDMALAEPTAELVPGTEREPRWNLTFSYNLR